MKKDIRRLKALAIALSVVLSGACLKETSFNAFAAGTTNTSSSEKKTDTENLARKNIFTTIPLSVFSANGPALKQCGRMPQKGQYDKNAKDGNLPGKTEEEIQTDLNKKIDSGMFNISIDPMVTIDRQTMRGKADVENILANPYLMSFSITINASDTLLYRSGYIKPGQFMDEFEMEPVFNLKPGVYDATAIFSASEQTTFIKVGQAEAEIKVLVR